MRSKIFAAVVSMSIATLALSACQTLPQPQTHSLSAGQVDTLRAQGFVQTAQGWEFGMADPLLFATDESRLKPEQGAVITRIAQALLSVDIRRARVEGHTDETGSDRYNDQLSFKRASAVAMALTEGGMHREDLTVRGLGKHFPLGSNHTTTGRQENRRVVIIVASQ